MNSAAQGASTHLHDLTFSPWCNNHSSLSILTVGVFATANGKICLFGSLSG
jgi:hypothetical protein